MEQVEDVVLEDTPEVTVEENKTETKIAANDSQTPEDGIAELKERLETEKRLRLEAEARAHQAQNTATKAAACLLYTSPSPRDRTRSRMPSSA